MNPICRQKGIASVLYYKSYNASLLGNFKDMKMYYNLLEDEYKNSIDKEPFQLFFDEEKLKIMESIKYQIKIGKCFETFEEFSPIEKEIEMSDSEIEEEKLIVKKIAKNQEMLIPFIGDKISLISIEYPCGDKKNKKDRCDMVSKNHNGTIFPIEFKLNKANHSVVGQIEKYCLHFKLRLINQTYKRVQGVVIAHSYSKFAINELKKRGHICLRHSGNLQFLKLYSI